MNNPPTDTYVPVYTVTTNNDLCPIDFNQSVYYPNQFAQPGYNYETQPEIIFDQSTQFIQPTYNPEIQPETTNQSALFIPSVLFMLVLCFFGIGFFFIFKKIN